MTSRWDFLLEEAKFESVFPKEYARFARPVRAGLRLFLEGLPQEQQRRILRAQLSLPATTSFSQRLGVLARCSPVLHKVGQTLARDSRLPLELRLQLQPLESLEPSVDSDEIERSLIQELGPLDRLGITLMPAIAEASVSVVTPFRQQGTAGSATTGVLKVLKPNIEQQLEAELSLLDRVGQRLDDLCEEMHLPQLDYQDAFQQAQLKLLDEIQLENEQRHLVEAKQSYADQPRVKIPELLEHCTRRVTAMSRISGGRVTDNRLGSKRDKTALARLIGQALVARPVFSKQSRPLFHGDPHAGNLFLTDDGCLGILDWSLAGRLSNDTRTEVMQILLAGLSLDGRRMSFAIANLSDRSRIEVATLRCIAEAACKRIRHGQVPGLSWLTTTLDEAVEKAGLRVCPDLMLFRKSLKTIEDVIADVGESQSQIDYILNMQFLRHFAFEFPFRFLHEPGSRRFSTKLSNLDLAHTMLASPAAMASFWTNNAFDLLGTRTSGTA